MIPIPGLSSLAGRLIILAVVAMLGFAGGWTVNGWRLGTQLAEAEAAYAKNKEKVASEAEAAAELHQRQLEAAQAAIAAADQKHTEEMTRVQADADAARAAVADGTRSLSIDAACPDNGSGNVVPGATHAARVAHAATAARAVIGRSTSEALIAIAQKGDRYRVQLEACQDYVGALESAHHTK